MHICICAELVAWTVFWSSLRMDPQTAKTQGPQILGLRFLLKIPKGLQRGLQLPHGYLLRIEVTNERRCQRPAENVERLESPTPSPARKWGELWELIWSYYSKEPVCWALVSEPGSKWGWGLGWGLGVHFDDNLGNGEGHKLHTYILIDISHVDLKLH